MVGWFSIAGFEVNEQEREEGKAKKPSSGQEAAIFPAVS